MDWELGTRQLNEDKLLSCPYLADDFGSELEVASDIGKEIALRSWAGQEIRDHKGEQSKRSLIVSFIYNTVLVTGQLKSHSSRWAVLL